MQVVWTRHARERFYERSLKYGASLDEARLSIVQQKVRLRQPEKSTLKTIFKIGDDYFTAIKAETKSMIRVISIWEADEKEVGEWKKRQNASSAREQPN